MKRVGAGLGRYATGVVAKCLRRQGDVRALGAESFEHARDQTTIDRTKDRMMLRGRAERTVARDDGTRGVVTLRTGVEAVRGEESRDGDHCGLHGTGGVTRSGG